MDSRVFLLQAFAGSDLVGYAAAITDWTRFWQSFAWRHPFLAISIATRKLRGGRGGRRPADQTKLIARDDEPSELLEAEGIKLWRESSPHIAKILHVGVLANFRGRGVATSLYRRLMDELALRGVQRLDAWIDPGNIASLRLHQETGWSILRQNNGYIATISLKRDGQ